MALIFLECFLCLIRRKLSLSPNLINKYMIQYSIQCRWRIPAWLCLFFILLLLKLQFSGNGLETARFLSRTLICMAWLTSKKNENFEAVVRKFYCLKVRNEWYFLNNSTVVCEKLMAFFIGSKPKSFSSAIKISGSSLAIKEMFVQQCEKRKFHHVRLSRQWKKWYFVILFCLLILDLFMIYITMIILCREQRIP